MGFLSFDEQVPRDFIYLPETSEYAGYGVSTTVLKYPGYAHWIATRGTMSGEWGIVQRETRLLICHFDSVPIERPCQECGCRAVRFTSSSGRTDSLYFWCARCSHLGTDKQIAEIKSYSDAVKYGCSLSYNHKHQKKVLKSLIGLMAQAKGFAGPLNFYNLAVFFNLDIPT